MSNNVGYKIKNIPNGFEVTDADGRILTVGDTVLYYDELYVTYKQIPSREYLYIKPDDNSLTDFNIDITVPTGTTNYGFEWSEVNSDNTDWNAFTTASTSYGIVYSATGLTGDIIYLRGRYRGGEIQVSVTTGTGDSITDIPFSIGGYLYSIVTDEFDYLSDGTSFNGVSFYEMFNGTNITDISKLKLPNFVNEYVYSDMFCMCESLTGVSANLLPATTLANGCYYAMFNGCTSLTTAPELPATTLASECYQYMFSGCTSLTTAPNLPKTSLADYCYYEMFAGCSSLLESPTIDYDYNISYYGEVTEACYNMFSDCTSLRIANPVKIYNMGENCCYGMFYGCTSLTETSEVFAAILSSSGNCQYMFNECTNLVYPPKINLGDKMTNYCCRGMFANCTKLEAIPLLTATRLAPHCYDSMFSRCTSINGSMGVGDSEITSIVINNVVELAQDCYYRMFRGCTAITSVHFHQTNIDYPINNTVTYYREMFKDCSSVCILDFSYLTTFTEFSLYGNNNLIVEDTYGGLPYTSWVGATGTTFERIFSGMCDGVGEIYTQPNFTSTTGGNPCRITCFWGTPRTPGNEKYFTNTKSQWLPGDENCAKGYDCSGSYVAIPCLQEGHCSGTPPCNRRHGIQLGYVNGDRQIACILHHVLHLADKTKLKWVVTEGNDNYYECYATNYQYLEITDGDEVSAWNICGKYPGCNT